MEVPVVVAVLFGATAVVSPAWRVAQGWITLAHELGHAVAAIVTEGRVRRITVSLDASGLTEWSREQGGRRLPRGFVAWWGYPAPGALAVLVGTGVATGHSVVTGWAVAAVLAIVVAVWVRRPWGVAMGVTFGATAAAGAALGDQAAPLVGCGIAALWAVGGLRTAVTTGLRARRGDGSDQATLATVLWLPVAFWSVTMVVVAGAAVAAVGALLLPVATG